MHRQDSSGSDSQRAQPSRHRGFLTLTFKEVRRFWSVLGQTVTAPVVTALLYLLVFSHAMAGRPSIYPGVDFLHFLVPGLMMMSILQNAFANTSSSIAQSKINGNLVFVLMAPISPLDFYGAYVLAAMLRALLVGLVLWAVTWPFVHLVPAAPLSLLLMFAFASASLAVLGMIAGIVSDKFDRLAAFQNFFIMPLTFLSGVFYSVHSLPPFGRGFRTSTRFLPDRRLPLRFLRRWRRPDRGFAAVGRRVLRADFRHRPVDAAAWLSPEELSRWMQRKSNA
jgi:ABC-type multidrug transport system, permease component